MNMTIEEIIIKYNLNQSVLARIIGKKQGTFNEKLHKLRRNKFTDEQRETLTTHLKSLSNDINNLS